MCSGRNTITAIDNDTPTNPPHQPSHLTHLLTQIRCPHTRISFVLPPHLHGPTSGPTYVLAVQYAHTRYLTLYTHLTKIYDRIDVLRSSQPDRARMSRLPFASHLHIGDSEWLARARKGELQGEIRESVAARGRGEWERERVYYWWEEALRVRRGGEGEEEGQEKRRGRRRGGEERHRR